MIRNYFWHFIAALSLCFMSAPPAATILAKDPDLSKAGNEKVAEIMRTFGGRGVMADDSQPTPADQAVTQFKVRDGFEIDLVVSEPIVTQPLFLSWDSRGRMWVVQYRQYQYPAGLKVIRFDQHLRAVFDRVPDPPPGGVPGQDKISVHEDTDGDGIYDHHKDVITGLNIATSVQTGNGEIWVLNPPYLLRYPDADRDDIPDADPEVHLSGFGLQDTHSVANSLLWGPDGWLYGSNGSTTVGDVSSEVTKGVRFQGQCIWRYHPETKVFEIYAEGGGNTFSLEIDSKGRVFSGTNGGNTRGWYYPQGSYSHKNWGKHGPLTNPYAFGFFQPMRFEGDGRRFAQAFCIYEGGLFPTSFDGTIIAPNAMHNLVWNSRRIPDGSTFRTIDEENLVVSPDRWFRPVYAGVGPDGAAYLADWYDTRLSHVSPIDDWHKSSGRIYRVRPTGTSPRFELGDLHARSSQVLIGLLTHPNKWVRKRAILELGWRDDPQVTDSLVAMVDRGSDAEGALEALWALNLMKESTTQRLVNWLSSPSAHVRRWCVRLMGDRHEGHSAMADLANHEGDVEVRSQLAATAKRIPAKYALPVIESLVRHDEDVNDPHMPLMIWWALESHSDAWESISSWLQNRDVWDRPIFDQYLASRLMQRYAASGTPAELERCAQLLEIAPDDHAKSRLMEGLNRAFQGLDVPPLPATLAKALDAYQAKLGDAAIVLQLRQRKPGAIDKALQLLRPGAADVSLQMAIVRTLGEVSYPQAVPTLIQLATARLTKEPALQRVAIGALATYDDESIGTALVGALNSQISAEHGLRAAACRTLASRPQWASKLLQELNQWHLRRDQVPPDVVQQLRSYEDPEIIAAVEQAFGKTIDATSPERIAEMQRLKRVLASNAGDPEAGKKWFTQRCATCHQLFGEGNKVGPPLDGYERGNVQFWINAIVAPSLEIREGFQSYLVLTVDGRSITGMIAAQDPRTVTIRNAENQLAVIDRDDIEQLRALPTSLMPDDVLKDMSDAQIRDLLAYLSLGAKK